MLRNRKCSLFSYDRIGVSSSKILAAAAGIILQAVRAASSFLLLHSQALSSSTQLSHTLLLRRRRRSHRVFARRSRQNKIWILLLLPSSQLIDNSASVLHFNSVPDVQQIQASTDFLQHLVTSAHPLHRHLLISSYSHVSRNFIQLLGTLVIDLNRCEKAAFE